MGKGVSKSSGFYLNRSLLLEESGNPLFLKLFIGFVAVIVTLFVVWGIYFRVEEVAVCSGDMEPIGRVQKIQHLYGGKIKEIKVKEGDSVAKGQVLMVLDGSDLLSNLLLLNDRIAVLKVRRERIKAFVEKRKPDYSGLKLSQDLISEQDELLDSFVEVMDVNRDLLKHQVQQLELEIKELAAKEEKLQRQLELLDAEIKIQEHLETSGATAKVVLLRLKRGRAQIEEDLMPIPQKILRLKDRIGENQIRLKKIDLESMKQARIELERVTHDLVVREDEKEKLEHEISMLTIKSPCEGFVHTLRAYTVGGVIRSGDTIMEIVPQHAGLEGVVYINPRDIGHVHAGQKVNVKFTTYDYGRYGALKGKLVAVSPTSVNRGRVSGYYKGTILLDTDFLETSKGKLPVFAGMSFRAEVHTGSKSLMEYLLRPIFTSAQNAMHER